MPKTQRNKDGKPFRRARSAIRLKPASPPGMLVLDIETGDYLSAPFLRTPTGRPVYSDVAAWEPPQKDERLLYAAIKRTGVIHTGHQNHADVRRSLGDEDPYQKNLMDDEGFVTSTGRFLTRAQAVEVGVHSGQLRPEWLKVGRPLLSSDVW